jgi:hypothetical protein
MVDMNSVPSLTEKQQGRLREILNDDEFIKRMTFVAHEYVNFDNQDRDRPKLGKNAKPESDTIRKALDTLAKHLQGLDETLSTMHDDVRFALKKSLHDRVGRTNAYLLDPEFRKVIRAAESLVTDTRQNYKQRRITFAPQQLCFDVALNLQHFDIPITSYPDGPFVKTVGVLSGESDTTVRNWVSRHFNEWCANP